MDVKVINSLMENICDDLQSSLKQGSRLAMAAAFFSIYAFDALRETLEELEDFRFIFTEPTFTQEQVKKQQRKFYIPRLNRELSLYGSQFEIKLKNVLEQRAIARECAEWIRQKATFKANMSGRQMNSFLVSEQESESFAYTPMNGFTTVDLGIEKGNYLYQVTNRINAPFAQSYVQLFEEVWQDDVQLQDVTEAVIQHIEDAYKENSPELIYFRALYTIFHEFLEDLSVDELPNDATGFKKSHVWQLLYDFQQDAVLAIINKLERHNGCILADSVGLGKTFTALAVIKYYENRNKTVLVLCPKKLSDNWNSYKENYVNNPLAKDRLNYDVLFHTDLSRKKGYSNTLDLERINWGNYDLVVIDESHNFRNGSGTGAHTETNRYDQLMERVIKNGVKTKVLMLSATPVNNRFTDLKHQLALAYNGEEQDDKRTAAQQTMDAIFKRAQRTFNEWSTLDPEQRTTEQLLQSMDLDFFQLLDDVTIARSRKHIERYYDTTKIGQFPTRLKPISLTPPLTTLEGAIQYQEIYDKLMSLSLCVYTPSNYIFASKLDKYINRSHDLGTNLTQIGRETGLKKLMSTNLLKRLESSVNSFRLTIHRMHALIQSTLDTIHDFDTRGLSSYVSETQGIDVFDHDDENTELFTIGRQVTYDLQDLDYKQWETDLQQDEETLALLMELLADITPQQDAKLQELRRYIQSKVTHPINEGNKKLLIFTAFADTAQYLYEELAPYIHDTLGLHCAIVTGSVDGQSTLYCHGVDLNRVLTDFSPQSKGRAAFKRGDEAEIDVLIATDCISEGQNLQDCDTVVNYDIHWNPVRIIQRFGRIDRIGSQNAIIQLVNFWPDLTLDDYIHLKSRVETRMKISIMTATGDDDLINPEEKGDLTYRKEQLQRLQEEVTDLEDMNNGISIMDLGLNEFRLDLLDYLQAHPELEHLPRGLHAVVPATTELPPGVLFVLRNTRQELNPNQQNRIHPYYMLYLTQQGDVFCDHLHPKKLLDTMRHLCKGHTIPITTLCKRFNQETDDGRSMGTYSALLTKAIEAIATQKEVCDLDSLFTSGGTTALVAEIQGMDDFELECFLVIKEEN